jgi:hypothetical protein
MPTAEQQSKWNRAWYERNKEKRKAITRQQRNDARAFIQAYKKSHPCACGEDNIACLLFHHTGNEKKELEISRAVYEQGWSIKRIQNEIEKCIVMCANCHLKLHWNEKHAPVAEGRRAGLRSRFHTECRVEPAGGTCNIARLAK